MDNTIYKKRRDNLSEILPNKSVLLLNADFLFNIKDLNFSDRFVPPGSLKDTYLILFVFKYLIIFFKLVDFPEASIPSKTIIGYLDITPDKEIYWGNNPGE